MTITQPLTRRQLNDLIYLIFYAMLPPKRGGTFLHCEVGATSDEGPCGKKCRTEAKYRQHFRRSHRGLMAA